MTRRLGRQHPTIRRLRALRDDAALRRREAVFVAEGLHLAREALAANADVELFLVAPRLDDSTEGSALLRAIASSGVERFEVDDGLIDSVQQARNAQPVLTLVRRRALAPPRPGPILAVVALGIQDPGNLGGLLRTADAAGATEFLVDSAGADPYHPRAVRATMGSIFRLPPRTEGAMAIVEQLRGRGLRLVGTAPSDGEPHDHAPLTAPLALFFGGEGAGLAPEVLDRLDGLVRVRMAAGVESLSVGAAAAVVLFEVARRRDGADR